MAEAPLVSLRAIELYERPVTLRMPFRFGVVTLREAPQGFNPLLASYGPALVDRAILDALCRALGVSFYAAMQGNLAGVGEAHPQFAGFDWNAFLRGLVPATHIHARHTVGLVDAITAA